MSYTVFIPCAGLGTRLGELTRNLPKALVSVGLQPAITRILTQFPRDARFVIALGYHGDLLREYLGVAHPDRHIEFVEVSPYAGEGSGLGKTLLCAQSLLQEPFVFCSCDTLIKGGIPPPTNNWAAWDETPELAPYRTLDLDADLQSVSTILEKGQHSAQSKAYIGLSGIANWQAFWSAMNAGGQAAIDEGEAWGLNALGREKPLLAHKFSWRDIGTNELRMAAEFDYPATVDATILPKENEAIWFIDDSVIKFSTDTTFIANRVDRVRFLQGYVPPIASHSRHFYRYQKIAGDVLSRHAQVDDLRQLLSHCETFWQPQVLDSASAKQFHSACTTFYREKTFERIALFYRTFAHEDNARLVNGVAMPSLADLLGKLDWEWLATGLAGRFHGDFHFENIVYTPEKQFCFLDWRQDFCGQLEFGDIYYDLAKLNHGLIVNHELISADHYTATWEGDSLRYDFHRYQRLVECEDFFAHWLTENGYDLRKTRTLTALIYLNIAALHHAPYSLLLYGLGKSMLHRELLTSQ